MAYAIRNVFKCFCNGNLTCHPSEAKHNDMTRRSTEYTSKQYWKIKEACAVKSTIPLTALRSSKRTTCVKVSHKCTLSRSHSDAYILVQENCGRSPLSLTHKITRHSWAGSERGVCDHFACVAFMTLPIITQLNEATLRYLLTYDIYSTQIRF